MRLQIIVPELCPRAWHKWRCLFRPVKIREKKSGQARIDLFSSPPRDVDEVSRAALSLESAIG